MFYMFCIILLILLVTLRYRDKKDKTLEVEVRQSDVQKEIVSEDVLLYAPKAGQVYGQYRWFDASNVIKAFSIEKNTFPQSCFPFKSLYEISDGGQFSTENNGHNSSHSECDDFFTYVSQIENEIRAREEELCQIEIKYGEIDRAVNDYVRQLNLDIAFIEVWSNIKYFTHHLEQNFNISGFNYQTKQERNSQFETVLFIHENIEFKIIHTLPLTNQDMVTYQLSLYMNDEKFFELSSSLPFHEDMNHEKISSHVDFFKKDLVWQKLIVDVYAQIKLFYIDSTKKAIDRLMQKKSGITDDAKSAL